ncbi:MAG: efflux RND transporter periplasmic adaptor subunit [Nitrospinaceae bacterium]|nr:efflux RND transporter periplasmic adaptor subunit [Nitrospinaceae bacterium]
MKKTLIVLVVITVLLITTYTLSGKVDDSELLSQVEYNKVKVLKGDLIVKVSAKGIVEPNFKVEVKSKASGKILKFSLEEGEIVKKGQALLHLNKNDETRNVAKANADLTSGEASLKKSKTALLLQKNRYETDLKITSSEVEEAEVNLEDSKYQKKRQYELYEKKYISEETLEKAVTSFKVNQENLTQAKIRYQAAQGAIHDISMKKHEVELAAAEVTRRQIALDESKERLEETDIYSPISGVIIQKLVEEGQIISSGVSSVSGGTPLAEIADMSRIFIIADVDETDIGEIREEQKVEVTADAFYGKIFKGKVLRISPKGVVENSITIFKVKIEILGQGKNVLKPMMSSNVDIVTNKIKNTVYVSRQAIRLSEGKSFAVIINNEVPEEIEIKTGIRTPLYIEVLTGLVADQEVIIGDWEKLIKEAKESKNKGSALKKILWMVRSK